MRQRSPSVTLKIDGHSVPISNGDKILYRKTPFRKRDVVDYYLTVAPYLIPHLRNRALTLKRFPDGINGPSFYEKWIPSYAPEWITTVVVPRTGDAAAIPFINADSPATLAWCANLAAIELHPLLSKAPHFDTPSFVVFDLDPGAPATISNCIEVAFYLKEIFDALHLESFPKSSGSKGLQLYVPLNGRATYADTAPFAHAIAKLLESQHPDLIVATMSKAKRAGKVFIDWSQNDEHKSTIAVYSLRANAEQPFVSFPFSWRELRRYMNEPRHFFLEAADAQRRLLRHADIFAPVQTLRQRFPREYEEIFRGRRFQSGSPPLSKYRGKRTPERSGEPPGYKRSVSRATPPRFVIHQHAARRLHFDLRLEMEGVFRSWAIPKGVPLMRNQRHLAVLVEDHPLEYGEFEGNIPPSNYGAGAVQIWDRGVFAVLGSSVAEEFAKGKLHLVLEGEKLHGEWALVRSQAADGTQWFIIRLHNDLSLPARSRDRSVVTGRTLSEITSRGAQG